MKQSHYEILGWIGTFLVLGAYFLVSFGWLDGESLIFQLMNIFGSLGLLAIAFSKKVYQSVVVNIVWILIGLVAMAKLFF